MHVIKKVEEWVKCEACSGTGTVTPAQGALIAALNAMKLKRKDRAHIVQGVCTACGGATQLRLKKTVYVERVGFFTWLKRQIF